jgi:hypothetical protein
MTTFCGHNAPDAAEACCTSAPDGRSRPSLCQHTDAFLWGTPSDRPPKSHCNWHTGETPTGYDAISADTSGHCGRPGQRPECASSGAATRSTATVYSRVSGQNSRLHRLLTHLQLGRRAASASTRAAHQVFFNPDRQRFSRDPKDSTDSAHTGPFLIGPQNFFSAFLGIYRRFRGQDADRPALFAQILLTATPIMPVFDNMWTATFPAVMMNGCGDHPSTIIAPLFSCKKIIHHLIGSHYQDF